MPFQVDSLTCNVDYSADREVRTRTFKYRLQEAEGLKFQHSVSMSLVSPQGCTGHFSIYIPTILQVKALGQAPVESLCPCVIITETFRDMYNPLRILWNYKTAKVLLLAFVQPLLQ